MNGSFCNLGKMALGDVLKISSLHSADEPQEGRNSCPLLRSCYMVSRNVFHVVSALQSIVCLLGRLRPKGVPFSRFRYMKG